MRKAFITCISICIIVIIVIFMGHNYYNEKVIKHPFKKQQSKVQVTVKNGESLYGVIDNLKKTDNVNSSNLMKYYIKKNNLDTSIRPGNYNFSSGITINEFVKDLNNGIYDTNVVRVTIPEGYDLEHIAAVLEEKGIISKDKFLESCKEYMLPNYIKRDKRRKYALEGFLFPDTYEFTKGTSGNVIIDTMLRRFQNILSNIEKSKGKNIRDDEIDRIVIMASIVEREIKITSERPIAASVFYNRLRKGIKLESCATVEYALGVHKEKLLNSDLKVKSPYNTYIVKGLPVGPISCPGKESIEAAIEPAVTNYLYFVSNNDGTHTFTDDYKKFLQVKKATQGF